MSTCMRGLSGSIYKRHRYVHGVDVVDGSKIESFVCEACGYTKREGLIEFKEKDVDNNTEV